jgi:hypothetical protein
MILITTTVQIYKEVFFKEETIDLSSDPEKKSFFKVKGMTKKAAEKLGNILD